MPLLLILSLLVIGWSRTNGQFMLNSEKNRLRQIRRKEDYSFDSKLKRATEECSYIAKNDDDSHREELLEKIKSDINSQKVAKFYEEREEDKKKSKKYYDKVERQVRNRVLSSALPPRGVRDPPMNFERHFHRHHPRRGHSRRVPPRRIPLPEVPPLPPWILETFEPVHEHHAIFKRSKDPSFFQGTFKDHNNCFSRCVFARMELVDYEGFPHESYLRKALEDYIDNRKIRSAKIRRVYKCFDEIKKVAIDDNCIYSAEIFKCMKLDEQGSWS